MQTILGTFDEIQSARTAIDQLIARGFLQSRVHLQSATAASPTEAGEQPGMIAGVSHFFTNLFSSDEKSTAEHYAEAVRRGCAVVAVDVSSDVEGTQVQTLMQQLGAFNVDERASQQKSQMPTGLSPQSPMTIDEELAFERDSAPVVEENWVVGKRTIDIGGLRVIKRMSVAPVSESIRLRQEKATVERKPVDRMATEADFQNFKEGTFEIRETAEEAVITKSARVVEEVAIGRSVTDRSETVSDSVRRTHVDVERLPGSPRSGAD